MTAPEIARTVDATVGWIVEGYVAERTITTLDGKPKVGKSSLVAELVRASVNGTEFLGQKVHPTPVVWLTEEGLVTFRRKLDRYDLASDDRLCVLPAQHIGELSWSDLLTGATFKCNSIGAKLLIIDTLAHFTGGRFESSPKSVLEVMRPLQVAAAEGLAVLVVRHERKIGGDAGDAGRGSNAFTAGVDIVLSLQRLPKQDGAIRKLSTRSRFDETPQSLAIELTKEGYVVVDSETLSPTGVEVRILVAAPATAEEAMSARDFELETGLRKTSIHDALRRLFDAGKLKRTGNGTRSNPHRYWKENLIPVPTPPTEP